jgi:hypothetical protein
MQYLVWGVDFGPPPDSLTATDAPDHEDWARVYELDPGFQPDAWAEAETVNDPRWVMIVDASDSNLVSLEILQDRRKIRGFAPRLT